MREDLETDIYEAARDGLKLNARKCKTLSTEHASNGESIGVNGREVEGVEEFPYLGATVEKEGIPEKVWKGKEGKCGL